MKKLIVLIAALMAVMFVVGCATNKGPTASELMASAKGSVGDGNLIGQATAKEGSKEASEKKAKERALFQIVRAMSYIVKEMADEQIASGRLSANVSDQFNTLVTTALQRSSLGSVQKADGGFDGSDTAWVIYYQSKADTLKEVTNAVNAAKREVAASNFNFDNFNAKFDAAAAREWK